MDKIVETKVQACLLCQVVSPVCIREPRQMSALPDGPVDEVSVAHVVVTPIPTTNDPNIIQLQSLGPMAPSGTFSGNASSRGWLENFGGML